MVGVSSKTKSVSELVEETMLIVRRNKSNFNGRSDQNQSVSFYNSYSGRSHFTEGSYIKAHQHDSNFSILK